MMSAMTITGGEMKMSEPMWTPGDERDFAVTMLEEIAEARRAPLTELCSETGPGVYLLFYTGAHRAYRRLSDGHWPVYVGCAAGLRERLCRHKANLDRFDLEVGDVWAAVVPTPSRGTAIHAEEVAMVEGRFIWNEIWFPGFGSRAQGANRVGQTPNPFSVLHNHHHERTNASEITRAGLVRAVRNHLKETVPDVGWKRLR
jgi:hypothetical protein